MISSIDHKISVHTSICKILAEIDPDLSFNSLNLQQNTNQLKITDINSEIKGKSESEIKQIFILQKRSFTASFCQDSVLA